jgi:hypothetical protein
MKRAIIKIIFILYLAIYTCYTCGCQRYESFGYDSYVIDYPWGSVGVKLDGTIEDSKVFFAKMSSPYDLYVWFELNKDIRVQRIEIKTIELKEKHMEKVLLSRNNLEVLRKENNQQNRFYFVFKRLNLDHKDMFIEFDFKFSSDRGTVEDNAHVELPKNHFVKFQILGV